MIIFLEIDFFEIDLLFVSDKKLGQSRVLYEDISG